MTTLGTLMKQYEHAHRRTVEGKQYLLLRLDGKAFHSYTKGLARPYDSVLMDAMDRTLSALCEQVQGVRFGYVESDEISLLLTDWQTVGASDSNPSGKRVGQLWMGGVEAKLLSLSASIATANFNAVREEQFAAGLNGDLPREKFHRGLALFDSRLWTFPATAEGRELVERYFLWRQRDSVKNSVTMAALAEFSHKQLQGLNTAVKQDMLRERGKPWEELPAGFRFGRYASKVKRMAPTTFTDGRSGEEKTIEVERSFWELAPFEDTHGVWNEATLPTP